MSDSMYILKDATHGKTGNLDIVLYKRQLWLYYFNKYVSSGLLHYLGAQVFK